MVIALYVIALAMIGGGAASISYGYGIVLNERGWTMVISGATVLAGGLVLLGIAVVAGRIRRIERELANFRDHVMRLGTVFPSPRSFASEPTTEAEGPPPPAAERRGPVAAVGQEEQAVLKAADIIPESGPPEPPMRAAPPREQEPAEPEPSGPAVVGTYNSGGNSYVMYADGAIEADTPTGRYRFKSLDELKDFIAAGGEDGGQRSS
jgi:hypothetical protein